MITILVADDHQVVRAGLQNLLAQEPDLEVVGEAADGNEVVASAKALKPDVIIMDIAMPGMNGIEATRLIVADNPAVRVVALSMYADRRFVTQTLRAGAMGYVLKEAAFEELTLAIRTVMTGKPFLSPTLAGFVVEEFVQQVSPTPIKSLALLTGREQEILKLLAEGLRAREIAESLNIGQKTVEAHRHNLMNKLELHSIAELTRFAIREGLTTA